MTSIKKFIKKSQEFFKKHILTLKYYDEYHRQSIIKLIVILIITIYVGNNFKLNDYLLNFIDSYKILRMLAVYLLCLTYVTSNDVDIAINDLVVAGIATGIFSLFVERS
jgi:hypothetical protein